MRRVEFVEGDRNPRSLNTLSKRLLQFRAQHPLTNAADANLCTKTGDDKFFFLIKNLKILCRSYYDSELFSPMRLIVWRWCK